ncbi:MAG: 4,5-DOPA dioxygenase extradiol [Chloroflexi bacterium]|nr:4,5-DOPA dioxygenase extradiol [Chloroflexota bacterium]
MQASSSSWAPTTLRQPVLFIGHGSPMNAIEDNVYSRAWIELGRSLSRPQAVLCISAHWETDGSRVTAMSQPRTIHDFYGFPRELNEKRYPAPGSPELARLVCELAGTLSQVVREDTSWGLDHGTWSVLARLFPEADIPVVQLSLDTSKTPAEHYALAKTLAPLRRRGVLIIGSGNVVHNLGMACFEERAYPWAKDFDAAVRDAVNAREYTPLLNYRTLGGNARLAVPSNEHYLPLLYILALQEPDEVPSWFCEQVTMCSISMRGLRLG